MYLFKSNIQFFRCGTKLTKDFPGQIVFCNTHGNILFGSHTHVSSKKYLKILQAFVTSNYKKRASQNKQKYLENPQT
jgi:hypothetical protein